jgi:hypothetical protein
MILQMTNSATCALETQQQLQMQLQQIQQGAMSLLQAQVTNQGYSLFHFRGGPAPFGYQGWGHGRGRG